jgi:hypothetical protein
MCFLMTLAATPSGVADLENLAGSFSVALAIIAGLCVAWALSERRHRLRAQRQLQAAQVQVRQPRLDEHNTAVAEQHRRLNDLSIAKLTAEVELLQSQLKTNATTADRHEAGKEFHELMVEKAKLEIDSLRLHITELRKRIEDWRIDSE